MDILNENEEIKTTNINNSDSNISPDNTENIDEAFTASSINNDTDTSINEENNIQTLSNEEECIMPLAFDPNNYNLIELGNRDFFTSYRNVTHRLQIENITTKATVNVQKWELSGNKDPLTKLIVIDNQTAELTIGPNEPMCAINKGPIIYVNGIENESITSGIGFGIYIFPNIYTDFYKIHEAKRGEIFNLRFFDRYSDEFQIDITNQINFYLEPNNSTTVDGVEVATSDDQNEITVKILNNASIGNKYHFIARVKNNAINNQYTLYIVPELSIEPNSISIMYQGSSLQLSLMDNANNEVFNDAIFTITSTGHKSGTTINSDNILTIDSNETVGKVITVRGSITGVNNVEYSIEKNFTIAQSEIKTLSVTPKEAYMKKGETKKFIANSTGNGSYDSSVDWELEGSADALRSIKNYNYYFNGYNDDRSKFYQKIDFIIDKEYYRLVVLENGNIGLNKINLETDVSTTIHDFETTNKLTCLQYINNVIFILNTDTKVISYSSDKGLTWQETTFSSPMLGVYYNTETETNKSWRIDYNPFNNTYYLVAITFDIANNKYTKQYSCIYSMQGLSNQWVERIRKEMTRKENSNSQMTYYNGGLFYSSILTGLKNDDNAYVLLIEYTNGTRTTYEHLKIPSYPSAVSLTGTSDFRGLGSWEGDDSNNFILKKINGYIYSYRPTARISTEIINAQWELIELPYEVPILSCLIYLNGFYYGFMRSANRIFRTSDFISFDVLYQVNFSVTGFNSFLNLFADEEMNKIILRNTNHKIYLIDPYAHASIVDEDGNVYIGAYETNSPLTLTATSVANPELQDSATIYVNKTNKETFKVYEALFEDNATPTLLSTTELTGTEELNLNMGYFNGMRLYVEIIDDNIHVALYNSSLPEGSSTSFKHYGCTNIINVEIKKDERITEEERYAALICCINPENNDTYLLLLSFNKDFALYNEQRIAHPAYTNSAAVNNGLIGYSLVSGNGKIGFIGNDGTGEYTWYSNSYNSFSKSPIKLTDMNPNQIKDKNNRIIFVDGKFVSVRGMTSVNLVDWQNREFANINFPTSPDQIFYNNGRYFFIKDGENIRYSETLTSKDVREIPDTAFYTRDHYNELGIIDNNLIYLKEDGTIEYLDNNLKYANSSIDPVTGLLTVDKNDFTEQIAVTATSKFDETKKDTTNVYIVDQHVKSVTITSKDVEVMPGNQVQLQAEIDILGDSIDDTINWEFDNVFISDKQIVNHPNANDITFKKVIYFDNKFLALANYNNKSSLFTSTDGKDWSESVSFDEVINTELTNIIYANNKFYAISVDGIIITSNDGLTWTQQSEITGITQASYIAYGAGVFIVTADNNTIYKSIDLITWTSHTLETTNITNFYMVEYMKDRFIITGNGAIVVSLDRGETWHELNFENVDVPFKYVGWMNSHFILTGGNGRIFVSPDVISDWTEIDTGITDAEYTINYVDYFNNQYYFITNYGTLITSYNLKNFKYNLLTLGILGRSNIEEEPVTTTSEGLNWLAHSNNKIVIVGNNGITINSPMGIPLDLDYQIEEETGVLTIGNTPAANSVKVKAYSVADPTKYDTIDVAIGIPSVDSVTITSETDKAVVDTTDIQLTAEVEAYNGADETVLWSLAPLEFGTTYAEGTAITADGKLSIGAEEKNQYVRYRATSNFNPIRFSESNIKILLSAVDVYPKEAKIYRGGEFQFNVDTIGNSEVTWSIENKDTLIDNNGFETFIDENGKLFVDYYDTNNSYTIKATSVADPTISSSATVTVETAEIEQIMIYPEITILRVGDSIEFTTRAKVVGEDLFIKVPFNWSISPEPSSEYTKIVQNKYSAVLTISINEKIRKFDVIATDINDTSISKSIPLKIVNYNHSVITNITSFDGIYIKDLLRTDKGKFFLIGDNGYVYHSTDAEVWTGVEIPDLNDTNAILRYANGKLFVGANTNRIFMSDDEGMTWTKIYYENDSAYNNLRIADFDYTHFKYYDNGPKLVKSNDQYVGLIETPDLTGTDDIDNTISSSDLNIWYSQKNNENISTLINCVSNMIYNQFISNGIKRLPTMYILAKRKSTESSDKNNYTIFPYHFFKNLDSSYNIEFENIPHSASKEPLIHRKGDSEAHLLFTENENMWEVDVLAKEVKLLSDKLPYVNQVYYDSFSKTSLILGKGLMASTKDFEVFDFHDLWEYGDETFNSGVIYKGDYYVISNTESPKRGNVYKYQPYSTSDVIQKDDEFTPIENPETIEDNKLYNDVYVGYENTDGSKFHTIVVGKDGFIAIGEKDYPLTKVESGTSKDLNKIFGAPENYSYNDTVIVIGDGVVLRSEDFGNTWVDVTPEEGKNINWVEGNYNKDDNTIIIIGEHGETITSNDTGDTWSYNEPESPIGPIINTFLDIKIPDPKNESGWIVGGASGYVAITEDLETWTEITTVIWDNINKIIHDGEKYIAITDNGGIYVSKDKYNWDRMFSGTVEDLNDIEYSKEKDLYIIAGDKGTVLVSKDGYNWEHKNSGTEEDLYSVGDIRDGFIIIGDNNTYIKYIPSSIMPITDDLENPLFFFNSLYDDVILGREMFENSDKLYCRSLDKQEIAQNAQVIFGEMSDFKVDENLNYKYKLPAGTYTYTIKKDIIPYYNKKRYITKYHYETPISLMEIFEDFKTFSRRILFKIDKYNFMNLRLLSTIQGYTVLCIYPDMNEGIMEAAMSKEINNSSKWCITFDNQSDLYYTYLNKNALFDNNTIALERFQQKIIFNKPDKINSWSIYISANGKNINLLAQSSARLIYGEDNKLFFEIDPDFYQYIIANTNNCKCYVLNEYRKEGSLIYKGTEDTKPIFQVPFLQNPIAIRNAYIYEYDEVNKIRMQRINNDTVIHYPNIFDFSEIGLGKSFIVEWYENSNTLSKFDNNFQTYMDYIGDQYASLYMTENAPIDILYYEPLDKFIYDYDDYIAHPAYGNVRKYKIMKLRELLFDNSMRYQHYIQKMNIKNRKYETFSTIVKDTPSILKRSLMDNIDYVESTDDIFYFKTPHTFIEFSSSIIFDKNAQVYINGKRFIPTLVSTYNYKTYVYIPLSVLTPETEIVVDMDIEAAMANNKANAKFEFVSLNSYMPFPRPDKFTKIAKNDLLFYNSDTKEYISNEDIDFAMNVPVKQIQKLNTEDERYNGYEEAEILITDTDRYFKTSHDEYFDLSPDYVTVEAPDGGFFKKVDPSNVIIKTKNASCINVDINVTNTNNYRWARIPDVTLDNDVYMDNFREDPNPKRFKAFRGGILMDETDYTYTPPTKYSGQALFTFNNSIRDDNMSDLQSLDKLDPSDKLETNSNEIIIEYLSYEEDVIFNDFVTPDMYYEGLIDLSEFTKLPIDLRYTKVFVNGKRVLQQKVHGVFGIDMIYIEDFDPITDKLTVMTVATDNDFIDYQSLKRQKIVNKIARTDADFAKFIIANKERYSTK